MPHMVTQTHTTQITYSFTVHTHKHKAAAAHKTHPRTTVNHTQWPTTSHQRSPHLKKRLICCESACVLTVAASSLVRDCCCLLRIRSILDLLLHECASSRLLLCVRGHRFAAKCQVPSKFNRDILDKMFL